MQFKLIKAAHVYAAELPDAGLLEQHLAERPFFEPAAGEHDSIGFVPTPTVSEGELVTLITAGRAFTARHDEKVIPASTVILEMAEAVKRIEDEQGYRVSRKQKREIKEAVILGLRAKALVRTKLITCFYHPATQNLIVPTSSQKLADRITSLLIQAVGAIEFRTIHVAELKGGLTTRLTGYVDDQDDTFAPFELLGNVWLEGDSGKVSYQLGDSLDGGKSGLAEQLSAGLTVAAVELEKSGVTFRLTSQFKFRGISFADSAEAQKFENIGDAWRHEADIQLLGAVDCISTLCDLFGYKAPAKDEPAAPEFE